MIAVKRLQSLFWVLLVALGALGAYLVSLRVATERNELMRVRAEIARARGDIRYLQTEFAARSNIRQLEKWNADDFRYSARTANQYLEDERQLAQLNGVEQNGPAYVAPPVMVAMIEADEAGAPSPQPAVPSPAALQIRSDISTLRVASAEAGTAVQPRPGRALLVSVRPGKQKSNEGGASRSAKAAAAEGSKKDHSSSVRMARAEAARPQNLLPSTFSRKAERMAMLDARLLDDRTLGDIGRRAAVEKGGNSR